MSIEDNGEIGEDNFTSLQREIGDAYVESTNPLIEARIIEVVNNNLSVLDRGKLTDLLSVRKVLRAADNFFLVCKQIEEKNKKNWKQIYEIRERLLSVILAPIHISFSFSGIEWLDDDPILKIGDYIVKDNSGKIDSSPYIPPETNGLAVKYNAEFSFDPLFSGQPRRNHGGLYESLSLRNGDGKDVDKNIISLATFTPLEGEVERIIYINSYTSPDRRNTGMNFEYNENGETVSQNEYSDYFYFDDEVSITRERARFKRLGFPYELVVPHRIDFQGTWDKVIQIARDGYPPNFEPSDFARLIVKT